MNPFDLLPFDIKQYVLRPLLSKASRLTLAIAFYNHQPIEKNFTTAVQKSIVAMGLSLTLHFWSWLHKERLYLYAAETGSLDVLKYLHYHRVSVMHPELLFRIAARNGHLSIIKYAYERIYRRRYRDSSIYLEAARGGHMDILDYALKNKFLKNTRACEMAAKAGNIEALEWFLDHSFYVSKSLLYGAARQRNTELLEYVLIFRWGEYEITNAIVDAISAKRIENVKILCTNTVNPLNDRVYWKACEKGALNILDYLFTRYSDWKNIGEPMHSYATERGNLPLIIFLDQRGCSHRENVLKIAQERGRTDIVNYFLSQYEEFK